MMSDSNDYRITTHLAEIDLGAICDLLQNHSYWANERPREEIERAFRSPASICFGLLDRAGKVVGCARVVTDRTTFGWVCDVIVHPEHRGKGLGKRLVEAVIAHPDLQFRLILATRDAHTFYEKYGFERREMMRRPASTPPPS